MECAERREVGESNPESPHVERVANPKMAILLACFNRRAKTLACLHAALDISPASGVDLSVILVDDGSTDGTASAVVEAFPFVKILTGDGNLYWAGGMRLAMAEADRQGADLVLWLNDDTILFPGALDRLIQTWLEQVRSGANPMVVGATCDQAGAVTTYGGVGRGGGWHRLKFWTLPVPDRNPRLCDTMNGNCTLIPMAHVRRLGGIHPVYRHALGDFDFGLRAKAAGIPILLIPGWVGTCDWNSSSHSMQDVSLPLRQRWRLAMGVKGLPPRQWWQFVRTHGGVLAPLAFVWPYLRLLSSGAWTDLRRWWGEQVVPRGIKP